MSVVPFTGASGLASVARRTRLVRIALAAALVALVLATAAAARHPSTASASALPVRSGDMIVLDLSASISQDTYSRIGETLRQLVATRGRYGLVVFSGVAYEALSPGTPASALRPLVRYFTLPKHTAPGFAPTFPPNPWNSTFSGGTVISSGLALAKSLLVENHLRHAHVVLVSDLHDDPEDRNRLNEIVTAYRRDGVPLRVVPLNAAPEDAAFFGRLTSTALKDTAAPPAAEATAPPAFTPARSAFPTLLVLLVIACALALAANVLWSARLRWGTR
jgi:hypothetical protein